MAPILWVELESHIDVPTQFTHQNQFIQVKVVKSLHEAQALFGSHPFSVVIVSCRQTSDEINSFLHRALSLQPKCLRLLYVQSTDEKSLRQAVNWSQVHRIILWKENGVDFFDGLREILDRHLIFASHSLLLKESARQNRELEALTLRLEELVEERTRHIEQSHEEETEKLGRERQLIRFIKDLTSQISFEDILQIVRKDFRKFHKLGDPILVYRVENGETHFLSFQSGHFIESTTRFEGQFPEQLEVSPPELVQMLANHFGRPFAKTVVAPLVLQGNPLGLKVLICVESALAQSDLEVFLDHLSDRLAPLAVALDKILLDNEFSLYSARWERTFDGLRNPIALVAKDFQVLRANRNFSDRQTQEKCYEVFAKRKTPCEACPAQKTLSEGKSQQAEIQVGDKTFQVHSYPIIADGSSQASALVHQYVDITEQRQLYLRMLQSEKMGAIGLLAGNIAHELNNPLTGLRSLVQVLLHEVSTEGNLASDLKEIEKAAERSQKIIKNLLEFSRSEEQPLQLASVDEVVEKTLPMLKTALRPHRTQILLNARKAFVYVEPHLLQQVIFNLLNNACQAMKDPGQVAIRSMKRDQEVILEIMDSGPGIPSDLQKKVFEPFFTTKQEGQGTGLGLSMARAIIEKFGGKLWYESRPQVGATFVISLPLRSREA